MAKKTDTAAEAPDARRRPPLPPTAIRRLRLRMGLTQIDLALAAGISSNWLAQVERYPVMLSAEVASKIAAALGCEPSEITEQ